MMTVHEIWGILIVHMPVQLSSGAKGLKFGPMLYLGKKGSKDLESIQSSTTPDPGYHMGK